MPVEGNFGLRSVAACAYGSAIAVRLARRDEAVLEAEQEAEVTLTVLKDTGCSSSPSAAARSSSRASYCRRNVFV